MVLIPVYKSTCALCCHDGNCCILSEMSSSSPLQAHVLQLQLSDFRPHRADHPDNPLFAVHGADHAHSHPACVQPTTRPHQTRKYAVLYVYTCRHLCPFFIQSWSESSTLGLQRKRQPIKSSNLVCHQSTDSLVTWWGEWYFLRSDLMPTTFSSC